MEEKKKKKKKPGEWGVVDILFGLLGLVAIGALAVAGFIGAKWVLKNFF